MTRDNPQTAPEKDDFRLRCQRSTDLSDLRTSTQARRAPCSGCHGEGKRAFENTILRIQAALLVINAADDERNPPETGLMDRELGRVKNARLLLIPASADTAGHGTTGRAKFYQQALQDLLRSAPRR